MKKPISASDVKKIDRANMEKVWKKFPVYSRKEDLSHGRGQGKRMGKMVMGGMSTIGLSTTIRDYGKQFGVSGDDLAELKLMSSDNDGPMLLIYYAKARYAGHNHGRAAAYAYMTQDHEPASAIAKVMNQQPDQNPIAAIFDTDNPLEDPDRALGYAAVYNYTKKALNAWHITSDAKRTMAAVKDGMPLHAMGHAHQELGPGLYMSAVPQLWMGRAHEKWRFLETLTDDERQVLTDALATIVLRQRQDGYITENEYKMANRDLGHFVEIGGPGFVLQLAGQPFNISFWKKGFLEPLGIKPGREPEVIEFTLKGIWAVLDNIPNPNEIEGLVIDEYDGALLRGGLVTVAQMVVWRSEAIVGMKRTKL